MFKPQLHKVIESWQQKENTRYRLKYNTRLAEEGNCANGDVELFYPDKSTPSMEEIKYHRRLCGSCPVKHICLEWALVHERHGIWGGTLPQDRDKMRKRLKIMVTEPNLTDKN